LNAIDTPNAREARVDRFDSAQHVAKLNKVANPNGTLRQENPAADEIADDILSAKSDANRDSARDKRECSEWDAKKTEKNQDNDDIEQSPHKLNGTRVNLFLLKSVAQLAFRPTGKPDSGEQRDDGDSDLQNR
jgi:hypothetical protein